jgi:hypothetical protein
MCVEGEEGGGGGEERRPMRKPQAIKNGGKTTGSICRKSSFRWHHRHSHPSKWLAET